MPPSKLTAPSLRFLSMKAFLARMLMIFWLSVAQGLLPPLCHSPIIKAEEMDPIPTLDPLVVTASTKATRLSQVPAAVTVIDQQQIASLQANRVTTLLQQIPGISVDEMGGRGGISSVYVRGGDPNFTLIMIDGIPINDPTNARGGSVNLSTLTPERIEQIEIVRGPVSVVYGSDALAGAINILTRKGQPDSQSQVIAEGGQCGYGRGVVQTSGSFGQTRYHGSLAFTRNNEQVEQDSFQSFTTGGNLLWAPAPRLDLLLTGQYSHSEIRAFPEGSGGSRLSILRDPEQRRSDEFLLGGRINHAFMPAWDSQFSANIFHRIEHVNNPGVQQTPLVFRNPPTLFHTNFSRYRFLWTLNHSLNAAWRISGGLHYIIEKGQRTGTQELTAVGFLSNLRTDFSQTRSTMAGFLETVWKPLSDATLTASLRVDDPQNFSKEVTPRVGFTIDLFPHTSIRGSYSEGFKLPSLHALSDPLIRNPGLIPETSRGWDVNFRHSFLKRNAFFDLTYFRNRYSNVVDLDPERARQNIFTLVNLSTILTQGIELEMTLSPFPWLTTKGFFTYLHTDIVNSQESLRNRPKTSGGFVVTLQPKSVLQLSGRFLAVGKRFDLQIPTSETAISPYYRFDLSATWHVSDTWKCFFVGENVTNVQYEEFIGFEAPRAWFRFGLTWVIGDGNNRGQRKEGQRLDSS